MSCGSPTSAHQPELPLMAPVCIKRHTVGCQMAIFYFHHPTLIYLAGFKEELFLPSLVDLLI